MKRIITIMMVMALVGGAAFARGNTEEANSNRQGYRLQDSGETVALTGIVEEMDGHVVLNSNGSLYSLSAPGFYRAGVEIPYGETIEVRGTVNTEPCDDCDLDAAGHIFVKNAMVNGEELAFANGRNDNDDKRGMGRKADQGNSERGSSGRGGSGRNDDNRRSGGRRTDDSDWTPGTGRWNNPEA